MSPKSWIAASHFEAFRFPSSSLTILVGQSFATTVFDIRQRLARCRPSASAHTDRGSARSLRDRRTGGQILFAIDDSPVDCGLRRDTSPYWVVDAGRRNLNRDGGTVDRLRQRR